MANVRFRARPGATWMCVAVGSLLGCGDGTEQSGASDQAAASELTWVATARQLGVVGYRDPVGAISPGGALLAYAEGRDVRVVPVGGGASRAMERAAGQVRHLAWLDDESFLAEDRGGTARWWRYDAQSGTRTPLWDRSSVAAAGSEREIELDRLAELSVSSDGSWIAGSVSTENGWEVWRVDRAADQAEATLIGSDRVFSPIFTSAGEIACVIRADGRYRLHNPCDGPPVALADDIDAVGPAAIAPSGETAYFASPDGTGMVELVAADLGSGSVRRLAGFSRDTYAPSLTRAGDRLLFRSQSYRTYVAEVEIESGVHRQLTLFQAETPSYSPEGDQVAFTYGSWRRQLDDVNYPDIAQHIGIVRSGAAGVGSAEPIEIVANSESEDQAMDWSPNGQWIAFHSHREDSDDVWLRPRDGSAPDRRISFLGRGSEAGWPRWSPDGQFVLFNGASPTDGRSVLFTLGVDQETGEVTTDLFEIPVVGVEGELGHAEWLPDSRTIVALTKEGPGQHALFTVPATGGSGTVFHRIESEHDFPGIAVRRDGSEVAFVQPAPDGYYQVFRMPMGGGSVTQVTSDPSDKTQPTWSPDGSTIAYTVWDYRSQFWLLEID